MVKKLIQIFIFIAAVIFFNCTKRNFKKLHPDPDPATAVAKTCDTTSTISYSGQVAKILNDNCNNCHNSTGTPPDLTNYSGVASSAQMGLVSCIVWDGNTSNMPKSASKVSVCDITIISKWVSQGVLNN